LLIDIAARFVIVIIGHGEIEREEAVLITFAFKGIETEI
jgi:hypothetical protein